MTHNVLWFQLKSTEHLKTTRDGSAALLRLERRDILAWIAEANPVILLLYDATAERTFWLSIQSYFADERAFARLHGKTVTVPIPTANLLSVASMREFAREKAVVRSR